MPELQKLARPILRASACLHADQALVPVGEELKQRVALDLLIGAFTRLRVVAVDLKHFLGNVNADDEREVARQFKIRHEGLL